MAPEARQRDRALGAVLGLAVGDAIGTTVEFRLRDSFVHLTDMVGGGPFQLKPGEWTDDTAMALALGESLLACGELDQFDLLDRFVEWWRDGRYSCTGRCFDIGLTVRSALARWQDTGDPNAGSDDPRSAGNGSLMRLSPVAVRYFRDPDALVDAAARQSRTTHRAPEAVDACVLFAQILADAINGLPAADVLRRRREAYAGAIGDIAAGLWLARSRDDIRSSGYVAHSLEAALWCVSRTETFRDAVLTAANLGEDADTTAAITGQLAGALYGMSGIPQPFLSRLAWRDRIEQMTSALWAAGAESAPGAG